MNKRFQASLVALAILLAAMALIVAQASRSVVAKTNAASRAAVVAPGTALAELPASDIIIFVDTQKLVSDTLPNFLAGDPTLFAKINAKLDKFQQETGIDPRTFDSLAIGLRFDQARRSGHSRFVAITRGSFVASDLIDKGFAAVRKKEKVEREEQVYEGKKIYVLASPRDVVAADAAVVVGDGVGTGAGTGAGAGVGDSAPAFKADKADTQRMAVAELDSNTIVMGDLESVRATINPGAERVDQSLVELATRTSGAFAGFAGNVPPGMAKGFGFGDAKVSKLAESIRQVYGSFSTVGTNAETLFAARTENADQARDIAQALNGLKLVSGLGIGRGSNKAEADAFSSLIKGLTVTAQDNEVQIKLSVTQPDIAPLLRHF
ncbi:MAG TPA: hypothetical protein VGX92_12835 [Pyrinomonadaceae bacterium]|jgi:hypothetical protein|nr:hypothetical protein [Pyrinomonadaceae bacterium]